MAKAKKILVVEDEKPLAHALELKLQKTGHTVTVAANGQEGLNLILKQDFDVVLLDLITPVMTGFQVLEKLHAAKDITTPAILVLSNLTQPEDDERVRKLGARKLLVKSDTPLSRLVDEIDQV